MTTQTMEKNPEKAKYGIENIDYHKRDEPLSIEDNLTDHYIFVTPRGETTCTCGIVFTNPYEIHNHIKEMIIKAREEVDGPKVF